MPPSNPTPPPGGGGVQKLSLDHESLQVLRELIAATRNSSQVSQRTSRTTAKAVDQQMADARQAKQSPARLKPPPKSFEQEVGEGIAAHQKRQALRSAIGAVVNSPPKSFEHQVGEGIASRQKRQTLSEAINAHFKPAEKTFEQQVGEGIASRQKRQSLHDAVSAHFKLPPKTFEQQVEHTVAARQSSKLLNDAVEAQLNPPQSFKERVQHAVTARKSSKAFNDAVEKKADPFGYAADAVSSRAAAPIAAALFAGNVVSSASRLAYDPYIGGHEAERQYFRDVVPGGGTFQTWSDNNSGRTAQIQRNAADTSITSQRGGFENDRLSLHASVNPLVAGIAATTIARQGQQPALPPIVDRSSASGEHSYQIAMKLLPLKQETLRTEIAMRRATAETGAAEESVAEIARRREQIDRRINLGRKERSRLEGSDSAAASGWMDEINALQGQADALRPIEESAHRTVYEKRAASAAAKGEHSKARTREELIGQAEVFQDQADRAKSGAFRLGAMNPWDREKAVMAAKIMKEHGTDALPDDMKSLAQQIAPREFEAAAIKTGANSRGYSDLQQSGFVDFPGAPGASGTKPSDFQHRADTKKHEAASADYAIDVAADAATEAAANKLAAALTKTLDLLVSKVSAKVDDAMRRGR